MTFDRRIAVAFRRELSDWRLWTSRVVVISAAAAAGLTVVGFTRLTDLALDRFMRLAAIGWWVPLLWVPACTAAIAWLTRRFAPGAAGSGIPQVMATLETEVGEADRGLFVSLRLALAKMALTSWGLLGGLSLGREGPCVQVAAGIMLAARRLLPRRSTVTAHGLLVAGGSAGIAAAFNTPLAGVMFAIEELSRTPEQRSSGLLISGILLAGLMAVSVNGNATYFGVIRVQTLGVEMLLPGLLVAVASGLSGGIFARLLIRSSDPRGSDPINQWRRRHPVAFAAGCGLALAIIGLVMGGATFGSGYGPTRAMLEGREQMPGIYVLLKFAATWLTTWSGVPGGLFAPALAIGAGLGNDIAMLTGHTGAAPLIALGMAGFLAATTQAPLTSFIIVMEMVDGHAMVLTLMACSLVASGVSRLVTRPLYGVLAQMQLERLPAREAPAPAPPPPVPEPQEG